MVQNYEDMQVPDIQGMSLASDVWVKAVKALPVLIQVCNY